MQAPHSPVHTSRSLPGSVAPTIKVGADFKSPQRSLPSRGPTSRDVVTWRFLDACQLNVPRPSLLPASKNLHKGGLMANSLTTAVEPAAIIEHG
jgi:hypothetical protein